MSSHVLDASAVLALLQGGPGHDQVLSALPDAVIGAVNLSEALSRLTDRNVPLAEARRAVDGLRLSVQPLTAAQAQLAAELRPATRSLGLGFGDRCCLALASERSVTALTADRAWASVPGVAVQVIR